MSDVAAPAALPRLRGRAVITRTVSPPQPIGNRRRRAGQPDPRAATCTRSRGAVTRPSARRSTSEPPKAVG
jgi:hypothetical protein